MKKKPVKCVVKKPIELELNGKKVKVTKIEYPPDDKVNEHEELLCEFMKKIFGINSFLVTDESSLSDFDCTIEKSKVVHRKEKILKKIKRIYGVDVSDVKGLYLHEVLDRIHKEKKGTVGHGMPA